MVHVPPTRPAYLRYRYALAWLNARSLLVWEPLAVAALCLWLGYGALDEADDQIVTASIFGFLIGVSCLANAAALAAGLAWGGAWRELPTSVSWHVSHAIEILPTLLHTSLLSQWAYRIDRLTSTPVWALLYFIAYIAHSTHVQSRYVMVATFFIFGHQCALVAYGAMTLPNWSSPQNGGNLRWVNTVFVMGGITLNFLFIWTFAMPVVESKRFEDFRVHTRAKLLHDVAHGLVSNFLPAPVLKAVQDRAGNASGEGNDSEIVAWAYDPACVLQSDICSFTALGSRITPNELCGCGHKSGALSFITLSIVRRSRKCVFALLPEGPHLPVLPEHERVFSPPAPGARPARFLHDLFSRFDELAAANGVHKIETIGCVASQRPHYL